MPYCVELAVWSANPEPIPLQSITITIIQHPSSSSIIISSNMRPLFSFSTCHTIDSGSLGPKLMFSGQSMPTAQLLGDHDSKARQRLRRSPWTRADCSIACFFLNWPRWRLEDAGHNTPPPLQWSAARRVHNTPPPSQYYAPTFVAWKKSIDRLPRQSNAAEVAMHPDSSGRRV